MLLLISIAIFVAAIFTISGKKWLSDTHNQLSFELTSLKNQLVFLARLIALAGLSYCGLLFALAFY